MPDWLLPSLGIACPLIATAVVWVGKAEARRLVADVDSRIDVHVAEDKVIHTNVTDSLERIEATEQRLEQKLDRIIERRLR